MTQTVTQLMLSQLPGTFRLTRLTVPNKFSLALFNSRNEADFASNEWSVLVEGVGVWKGIHQFLVGKKTLFMSDPAVSYII